MIQRRTYYGDRDDMDSFHAACYHGFYLGGRYFRNIQAADSLAMPALQLIGNESLSVILKEIPGIQIEGLSGVTWFSYPLKIGDFSHWNIEGFHDDGTSMKEYLATKSVVSYLSCWSLIALNLSSLGPVDGVEFRMTDKYDEEINFRVPRDLLKSNLLFQYGDILCCGGEVYRHLEPALRHPFYIIKKIDSMQA